MKARSKNGLIIDFGAMMAVKGSTVAVGNAKMNARGDILTHGGLVTKTAEQVADSYYKNNPRSVSHSTSLSALEDEVLMSPSEASSLFQAPERKTRRKTSDE